MQQELEARSPTQEGETDSQTQIGISASSPHINGTYTNNENERHTPDIDEQLITEVNRTGIQEQPRRRPFTHNIPQNLPNHQDERRSYGTLWTSDPPNTTSASQSPPLSASRSSENQSDSPFYASPPTTQ
ncbi:MAG: hypothetical protein EZS28_047966 [Streblomastix strix]|uniref:Uncharacterized protein n=1 Tax=Streblomastix strix TaxID=222440 RepID=A0A5J4TE65_9EUKA|nr:MAG: hypothetical protein EZS28_047966 [Streblomastix strix]